MAAWARVASGVRPAAGLTDAQLALVGAIADTILPRTDSPSATDVGVPAFVDVIVSENYTDDERAAFLAGLDAIDARVEDGRQRRSPISPDARGIVSIESATDRRAEPARTYWRLKGLDHPRLLHERARDEGRAPRRDHAGPVRRRRADAASAVMARARHA